MILDVKCVLFYIFSKIHYLFKERDMINLVKKTLFAFMLTALSSVALAQVNLRIMYYVDGIEGEIIAEQLKKFEAENPGIKVNLDVVAYKQILEGLPVQLAAGEGPDMARVTDLGGLAKYYLDMRPFLANARYWEENFGPFLPWLRQEGDTSSIAGFMTQMTVTGPFINKTLFEQAGVAIPPKGATWAQWTAAINEVAQKLDIPIPLAMDRSGHRMAGPAIGQGAAYFDSAGEPAVVDAGFKRMAKALVDWHNDGTMSKELWGSVSGSSYRGANEEFGNSQVVMYFSGSWQIAQFSEQIGDAFDWWAVPQPCGAVTCTGMPGGAAMVAFKDTEHPEEVAKVMEFLAREENLAEYYGRTLFIPGHIGLSSKGVDFDTDNPNAKRALEIFSSHISEISPTAFKLQGYPFNRVMFNAAISRVNQAIVGEMSLDEAYQRIEEDVTKQIAEKKRGG